LGSARQWGGHRDADHDSRDYREAATLSAVPRPVVFDMDGVLVDSEPLYEAAFRAHMRSVGRPELGELFSITLGRRPAEFVPELAEPLGRSPAEIGDGLDAAAEALMDAELVGMPHARGHPRHDQ
jgi:beta-phosphoglucomutase-like phosphatase (HAD superfamily)